MNALSRPSRAARVAAAALLLTVALTLTGCGGSAPPVSGGVATFISAGRIDMPGVPVPPGAEIRMTAVQQLQVARGLLIPYLAQFKGPNVPVGLRLKDYRVNDNDINLIEGTYSPLVFAIRFDVLPAGTTNEERAGWAAGSGSPGPDGWILGKLLIMTVAAKDGAYYITGIDPGSNPASP